MHARIFRENAENTRAIKNILFCGEINQMQNTWKRSLQIELFLNKIHFLGSK